MTDKCQELDAEFVADILRRLDEAVDGLDNAAVLRLEQARRLALATGERPRRPEWNKIRQLSILSSDWLMPAGAFASILVTVVTLSLIVGEPGNGGADLEDDFELLTAGEDLELFENLEFYQWLQDHDQTG